MVWLSANQKPMHDARRVVRGSSPPPNIETQPKNTIHLLPNLSTHFADIFAAYLNSHGYQEG